MRSDSASKYGLWRRPGSHERHRFPWGQARQGARRPMRSDEELAVSLLRESSPLSRGLRIRRALSPCENRLQRKLSQIRGLSCARRPNRLIRSVAMAATSSLRGSKSGSKNGNRIERPSICRPTTAPDQISSKAALSLKLGRVLVNPSPAAGSRRARGLGPMIADERRDSRPALRNQALSERVVSGTTAAQREYRWARGEAQSCHNESALKPRSSVISVWRFK